jgi:RAB protein geranylgeranyltransferase component A
LAQLVSSKVYKHLEFQAVGNWWIYDTPSRGSSEPQAGTLKRIPNGREDIFSDRSIDVRAKRGVMKFLKFVIDYESQPDVWEAHAQLPLQEFLSAHFSMPQYMQSVLLALTLTLDLPADTLVEFSLPRIKRHLTSIGVFGPGFGAVIPKYGGGAEIAQVACRAGAVGGGVYVLGTGIAKAATLDSSRIELNLTNEESVTSGFYVHDQGADTAKKSMKSVSKAVSIISSDLRSLFATTVEGAPTAAVSVVYFPSNTLAVNGEAQVLPVYIMVHSSDTGECPPGQCKLHTISQNLPSHSLMNNSYEYLSTLSDTLDDTTFDKLMDASFYLFIQAYLLNL